MVAGWSRVDDPPLHFDDREKFESPWKSRGSPALFLSDRTGVSPKTIVATHRLVSARAENRGETKAGPEAHLGSVENSTPFSARMHLPPQGVGLPQPGRINLGVAMVVAMGPAVLHGFEDTKRE